MSELLDQLKALEYLPLRLYMRADETLSLPVYKGSTLRGAFGTMFKDTVCVVPHRDCDRCVLRANCAYPYVFETPVPKTSERLRKYPVAPHPFVILPALEDKRQYRAGEMLFFDLTLIGRGIAYLPYFVYTFAQFSERRGLGRDRGRCTLMSVQWQSPTGQQIPIYDEADQVLHDNYTPTSVMDLDYDGPKDELLTLAFLTPTRLMYEGRLVSDLQFQILCRTLLRRMSNLMYFHCGTELDVDYRGLIAEAAHVTMAANRLQWYDWKRYSSRQHRQVRAGGVVGQATFRGDWQPFGPLLQLGEFLHVGKGTSFGLGKYRIV